MTTKRLPFPLPGFETVGDLEPKIGIVGDVVLDANAESRLKTLTTSPWSRLIPWIQSLDLFILTFDGTFAGDNPKESGIRVVSSELAVDSIPRHPRRLFNLANNHSFDMGTSGFMRLRDALHQQGIETIGAGTTREEAEAPWIADVKGSRIQIFAAVHHGCHPRPPIDDGGQVADLQCASWWRAVTQAVTMDTAVFVLIHGGVQGSHYPSPEAISITNRLLLNGVTGVFWSHAHAIQGVQRMNGSIAAYGLGNAFYCPLTGDPMSANPTSTYDRGLFIAFGLRDNKVCRAEGIIVDRVGLHLNPAPDGAGWMRRLSERIERPGYVIFWRVLRLWEDVFLRAVMFLKRDNPLRQLARLRPHHARSLLAKISNARSDAVDV